MTDEASAMLGHNNPLFGRVDELIETCNRWTRERPVMTAEDVAGAAQDFLNQLRLCKSELEAALDEERAPLDTALAAVRLRYKQPIQLVDIARGKINVLLVPFLQAKDERLKREAEQRRREADEAQQRAEQALDRASKTGTVEDELRLQEAADEAEAARRAASKGPARAQVKGDYSPRASSLAAYWSCEIIDEAKALEHFAANREVRDATLAAISKVGNRLARHLKDERAAPPGLRFLKREAAR